jgi:archaemetzincin
MPSLHLVPIYCGPVADHLPHLARCLQSVFGCTVEQCPPAFDPESCYDAQRGQYNSRLVLARLRERAPADAGRILGVAGVDLFIPVLTYVFGEAELDGRVAVVSSFRLENELYGLPAAPSLLVERLVKEAIHEIGHTFGLLHCHRGHCVMTSSTYVEGIDLKEAAFCDPCHRLLRQRLRRQV